MSTKEKTGTLRYKKEHRIFAGVDANCKPTFNGNLTERSLGEAVIEYSNRSVVSANSPRDSKGNLMLRSNAYTLNTSKGKCPFKKRYYQVWSSAYMCGVLTPYIKTVVEQTYALPRAAQGNVVPGDETEAYREALTKFYGNMSQDKVNLAVAFAERQKTANMINNRAYQLLKLLRSFTSQKRVTRLVKDLSKENFNTISRRLANWWLEYQYGWLPLYNDVYNGMKQLDGKKPRFWATGVGKGTFTLENSDANTKASDRVTAKARCTITDPGIVALNDLGLINPAVVTWELIPFSFVVDWFLPIGNWLEAQTATLGLSITDTSVTRTRIGTTKFKYKEVETGNKAFGAYNLYTYPASEHHFKVKQRTTLLPAMPFPRLQNPMSVNHVITTLALLRQRMGDTLTIRK